MCLAKGLGLEQAAHMMTNKTTAIAVYYWPSEEQLQTVH